MRLLRSVFVWVVWAAGSGPAAGAARVSPGDWAGGLAEYGYSAEATITMGDSYTMAFLNFSYLDDGVNRTSTSEDGKYGEGHVGDASGVVVHVRHEKNPSDRSGCHMPLVGYKNLKKPWIALIKRGGCNFEDKVKHAYLSNASGVLIYNDKVQPTLDKMKLVDKSRNISAVFTFKQRGEELGQLADLGIEVMLNISVGTHCVRSPSNMNRTSVLFVSISFIVLMVMSISWLVFYYIQRFRYIHAKDRLSKRLCSAAKKALSKIPVKNLKVEDKEIQGDGECCAVCIEPYKISDVLRVLPCKHDFHKSCIDPWLLEHRTCPMCKMDILKYYGFVFTGSQESILQLDAEEGDRRATGGVSPLPRQEMPQQLNDIHILLGHHGFRRAINVLDRSHSMTYIEQIASEASRTSSYDAGHSERSSRASSPDEMTPSLSSNPSPLGLYSKFPPQSPTNEAASYEKRGIPAVHSTPSCSRQPVETTIVSEEHHREDITKEAV